MFGMFSGWNLSTDKVKALSAVDYQFLRAALGHEQFPENPSDYKAQWSEIPCDEYLVQWLTQRGFEVTLTKWHSMIPTGQMGGQATTVNHFHLPSIGLLVIDEVTWEEDCCTEELQKQLDDGWRILAVCYQMPKRRPDYILGRTKKVM